MERLAAVARALTESALQSRGGDGLQLGGSEEMGTNNSSATAERLPVFPSTKFAVNVICSRGRRVGVNEKDFCSLRSRQNGDPWPPGGTEFHCERRLENLFEQLALINACGRTDAQAAAALH